MSSCSKALPLNVWPLLFNVMHGVQKWKDCLNTVVMLLWFKMWRARLSSLESVNADAYGGEKFTFACPPASQFVFVSLRETLRSAQQHSDCADGCCTIAPVFSAMQINSQQGLYLLLKALNFHIFSVHNVIGLHFLYLGCHTNALYPTK